MSSQRYWIESKLGKSELKSFAIGWLADQRRKRREWEGHNSSNSRWPIALAVVAVVAQPYRPSIGQSKCYTYI